MYMYGKSNIYKRKLYWREMSVREWERKKMKNCVICLMESFTPLFTAWTWQTLFNHFQFCISNSASSSYIFSSLLLLLACLLVFIFSFSFNEWKWRKEMFLWDFEMPWMDGKRSSKQKISFFPIFMLKNCQDSVL